MGTCHWASVTVKESFEADSISAQMNPPSMKPDKLMSASTNSSSCATGIVVTVEGIPRADDFMTTIRPTPPTFAIKRTLVTLVQRCQ